MRENVPEVAVSPRARARSEGVLKLTTRSAHESPRRSRQEDSESSSMAVLGLASEEAVATFSPFHENDPLK